MNALERAGLLEVDRHLESRSLAELCDIRNFGTSSLLDLLCVAEAAVTIGGVNTAASAADTRRRVKLKAGELPAWGAPGSPVVPLLFRMALYDEPAPQVVQRWLGDGITLGQLDKDAWMMTEHLPPPGVLPTIVESVMPALDQAGNMLPFPQTSRLGPVLRQAPLRPSTMSALSAVGFLEDAGGIERATIEQLMRIPGFRVTHLVDLLCVIEAALPILGLSPMPGADGEARGRAQMDRDLRVVAAWAVGEHGVETIGAVLELAEKTRPQNVDAAWRRIAKYQIRDFAGDLLHSYSPSDVEAQFLAALDDREKEILSERILPVHTYASLDELARRNDLSRERIRQIEARVKDRLLILKGSPLGRLASTVTQRLGTAIPSDAEDISAIAKLVANFSEPTLSTLLLLHLAGPYRAEGTWLLHQPSRISLDATKQSLLDSADQSGVISFANSHEILNLAGIRHQWHDPWVARLNCLRRIGDGYLRWDGTTLDRLERALRLRGEPATAEELVEELGDNQIPRGIKYRLMEDPRFVRINKQSQFALPEWRFDEYTGIADEIAQEIERCGGVADADHLASTISSTYGVAVTSVRAYLGAPMFVRSDGGSVRLRTDQDGRIPLDANLSDAPDCCCSPLGWSLRIQIDKDILRGSGRGISAAFAGQVGTEPGSKTTIPGPESPITVSWPLSSITGPSIGSLRTEAYALDASVGDLLLLTYLADERRFEVRLVRASDIETANGLSRLALLHGLPAVGSREDKLTAIVHSLGLELNRGDDPVTIVDLALTRRRQDSWRQLLPEIDRSESLDDVLERLAKALELSLLSLDLLIWIWKHRQDKCHHTH
jgi:hypothetical protein